MENTQEGRSPPPPLNKVYILSLSQAANWQQFYTDLTRFRSKRHGRVSPAKVKRGAVLVIIHTNSKDKIDGDMNTDATYRTRRHRVRGVVKGFTGEKYVQGL